MRLVTVICGVLLVLVAVLFLRSRSATPPDPQTDHVVVIRVGHGHSPEHSYRKGFDRAGELLQEQTQGRITMQFFPNEQLGTERQMQEMVSAGSLDMAVAGVLNYYDSVFSFLEFPYLYKDRAHVKRVAYSDILKPLYDSLLTQGVRSLGIMEVGFRHITSSKPIFSPRDLVGIRIRTPENYAQIETFKALGAHPVPMSFTKIYGAIQNGIIDAQENPLENIYDGKLYEVQSHIALTGHIYNFACVLVSERLWKRLAPSDRAIVAAAIRAGCDHQMAYAAGRDQELRRLLAEKGVRFTSPDLNEFRRHSEAAYTSPFYTALEPRSSELIRRIRALADTSAPSGAS